MLLAMLDRYVFGAAKIFAGKTFYFHFFLLQKKEFSVIE